MTEKRRTGQDIAAYALPFILAAAVVAGYLLDIPFAVFFPAFLGFAVICFIIYALVGRKRA